MQLILFLLLMFSHSTQMAWVASKFTPFCEAHQQHRFSTRERNETLSDIDGSMVIFQMSLQMNKILTHQQPCDKTHEPSPIYYVLFLCVLSGHSPGRWMNAIPPLSNQVVTDLIINYEHLWKKNTIPIWTFLYYLYSTIELIHKDVLMLHSFILFLQIIKKVLRVII